MTRALVVGTFHASSTRDVWWKIMVGLEQNGVEVVPFDVMERLMLFDFLHQKVKLSKRRKISLPDDWSPMTMAYEATTGAALYHQCDAVIVVSPQYWPPDITNIMRRAGLRTIAVLTECPYEDSIHTPITSSVFDCTFLNDRNSLGLFESFCPQVEYLPHCYDPAIHHPPEEDERDESIVFVGTGYQSRIRFMKQVEWPVRLDMYGWYPKEWLRYDTLLRKSVRDIHTKNREETAELYRKAAASFSIHREALYVGTDETILEGEAYSLGPRNWELAACGCFQISDYRPELTDVFGDSVPVFETPDDFTRLMKRAFEDPGWRRELAERQRERAQPYSCQNVMRGLAQAVAA